MIDWLTVTIRLPLRSPVPAGELRLVDHAGKVVVERDTPANFEGSASATIRVSSAGAITGDGLPSECLSTVRIDGNFAKFLQGHGLWGCEDPGVLTRRVLLRLAQAGALDLDLQAIDINPALLVDSLESARVTRIDITRHARLESDEQCLQYIRALESLASLKMRGRGCLTHETLYFSKHSRRSSFKIYAKGPEFLKSSRKLEPHVDPVDLAALRTYAQGLLRFEATFRGLELDRLGCSSLSKLASPDQINSLFSSFLDAFQLGDPVELFDPSSLPPRLRAPAAAFLAGVDLRQVYPERTFYRHAKALGQHGLNVNVPPCEFQASSRSIVFPRLIRELRPLPLSSEVPEFARGTQLAAAA